LAESNIERMSRSPQSGARVA